jgi:hypothetical protein
VSKALYTNANALKKRHRGIGYEEMNSMEHAQNRVKWQGFANNIKSLQKQRELPKLSFCRADYLLVDFSVSERTLATPRDDWAELPSPLHPLPSLVLYAHEKFAILAPVGMGRCP